MSERAEQLLDELVRLTAWSMRQGMESQSEAILAFADAGLDSAHIAELLGTTTATVRSARQRGGKKSK